MARSHPSASRGVLRPGALLRERYRILRFLDRGGVGEVYEARDETEDRPVAVKILRRRHARDRDLWRRMRREFRCASRIHHPNVCRIHAFGSDEDAGVPAGLAYLVMELVSGATLGELVRHMGPLDIPEALPIVDQMTAGLQAAHDGGVVHRDFKSDNVLVARDGGSLRVVITDLGLARADVEGDGDSTITRSGQVLGTFSFMAPEQLEGQTLTPAVDVYALGLVLYEMVTGRLPFEAKNSLLAALERLDRDPTSPREHCPDLPAAWESAILRCLARDPAGRFGSPREVWDALGVS